MKLLKRADDRIIPIRDRLWCRQREALGVLRRDYVYARLYVIYQRYRLSWTAHDLEEKI